MLRARWRLRSRCTGFAADFAARAMDEHTVLATDTLAHLSDAFRYRAKDADGLTWICGLNEIKLTPIDSDRHDLVEGRR